MRTVQQSPQNLVFVRITYLPLRQPVSSIMSNDTVQQPFLDTRRQELQQAQERLDSLLASKATLGRELATARGMYTKSQSTLKAAKALPARRGRTKKQTTEAAIEQELEKRSNEYDAVARSKQLRDIRDAKEKEWQKVVDELEEARKVVEGLMSGMKEGPATAVGEGGKDEVQGPDEGNTIASSPLSSPSASVLSLPDGGLRQPCPTSEIGQAQGPHLPDGPSKVPLSPTSQSEAPSPPGTPISEVAKVITDTSSTHDRTASATSPGRELAEEKSPDTQAVGAGMEVVDTAMQQATTLSPMNVDEAVVTPQVDDAGGSQTQDRQVLNGDHSMEKDSTPRSEISEVVEAVPQGVEKIATPAKTAISAVQGVESLKDALTHTKLGEFLLPILGELQANDSGMDTRSISRRFDEKKEANLLQWIVEHLQEDQGAGSSHLSPRLFTFTASPHPKSDEMDVDVPNVPNVEPGTGQDMDCAHPGEVSSTDKGKERARDEPAEPTLNAPVDGKERAAEEPVEPTLNVPRSVETLPSQRAKQKSKAHVGPASKVPQRQGSNSAISADDYALSVCDLLDDRLRIDSVTDSPFYNASKEEEIRAWVKESLEDPENMTDPPKGTRSYLMQDARFVPEAAFVSKEIALKILCSENDAFKCLCHVRGDKETRNWDTDTEFHGVPWEPLPTQVKNRLSAHMNPRGPHRDRLSLQEARQAADVVDRINVENGKRAKWGQLLELNLGVPSSTLAAYSGGPWPQFNEWGRDVETMDCGCRTVSGLKQIILWKMGRLGSVTHPGLVMGGDSKFLAARDREFYLEDMSRLGKIELEDLFTHELGLDPSNPYSKRYRRKSPHERLFNQAYRVFQDIHVLAAKGYAIPEQHRALAEFLGLGIDVDAKAQEEEEEEPDNLLDERQQAIMDAIVQRNKQKLVTR
ncbi:hypothetical protein VNI00_006460 [Paramarasmius palmivorus]|uniref:Uncharacterized protein n=1 Tax=Paramarasmius palmivorus TaxID=297713 RepID=A0AAW0D7H0_9AGAR